MSDSRELWFPRGIQQGDDLEEGTKNKPCVSGEAAHTSARRTHPHRRFLQPRRVIAMTKHEKSFICRISYRELWGDFTKSMANVAIKSLSKC